MGGSGRRSPAWWSPSDAAPDHAAGCGNVVSVQLNDLLDVLDRAAANLVKTEGVWQRAKPHVARGLEHGADSEYDDLRREWVDLLPGLPRIHGWTITAELPDPEALSEEVFARPALETVQACLQANSAPPRIG